MIKLRHNKVFIGLLAIFFLGFNFVSAQNCPSSPNSVNSNNGLNYTQTLTTSSQEMRYINASSTINSICASDPNCKQYVCDTLTKDYDTADRKLECIQSMSNLFTKQEALRQQYSVIKDNKWDGNYITDSVGDLQDLMKDAGCQDHIDCKLGVKTSHAFLFCPVCSKIENNREELDINQNCTSGYIPVDGVSCCQPAPDQCSKPTITIGDGITTYESNDDLIVKIDYSKNNIGTLSYSFDKIKVDGAIDKKDYSTGNKIIQFTITPIDGEDKISVDVEEGCAVLETDKKCPSTEIDINREVPCQLTKDRQECSNISGLDQPSSGFTGFSSLLSNGVICEKGTLKLPFCPDMCLNWQINNQTCEEIYGSGRYDDGNGCCIECPEGKKIINNECVCDKVGEEPPEGKKLDENSCKRICDPTETCCGIELNTVVPFIGDCIEMTSQNTTMDPKDPNTSRVNQLNAFPFLMMGLSKIMVTVILIFSFLIVISAGLLMTTGALDGKGNQYSKGVEMVKNVIIGLILLGSSGLILRLINPNFFGG